MPARFAGDLFSTDVGAALNETDDQNFADAWQMARAAIPNLGMRKLRIQQGRMDAVGRGGGTGRSSGGLNWMGALGSLASSASNGAFNRGSKLPGFNISESLYDYKPSGLDFSSGWA